MKLTVGIDWGTFPIESYFVSEGWLENPGRRSPEN